MSKHQLTHNEYGFDVNSDNPFIIFRRLNEVAVESVGAKHVLDLSRGDPGYGMAPNVRGRQFFSYLVALDTQFNSFTKHFKDRHAEEEHKIMAEIEECTHGHYSAAMGAVLLKELDFFLHAIREAATQFGYEWSIFDVLFQIFKYATVSGGCYHDPHGELITRIVLAAQRNRLLRLQTKPGEYILTNGASHAIGVFFKAFGAIGTQFLKEGDTVLITSPVYFPYMGMLEARGMHVVTVSVDPVTGQFTQESFDALGDVKPKAIVLVDPDNPSGFRKSAESLKMLADYAEKVDALILSDEVYHMFFDELDTIARYAPHRTIRIDALSKIERSTGCRFGEYMITDAANDYLTHHTLAGFLPPHTDLRTYLHDAKSPDGVKGFFKHTTFVPGLSQMLGVCHMVLGEAERQQYRAIVLENMRVWYETLGLPWRGNIYYSLIDMNDLCTAEKRDERAEKKLLGLAERGVVLIPSNRFFSKDDRKAADRTNYVRASLPNVTTEEARRAAGIMREYLGS